MRATAACNTGDEIPLYIEVCASKKAARLSHAFNSWPSFGSN